MNIDLNNPAVAALALNRLRLEYAEIAFINLVLDEMATRLTLENEALRKQNTDFAEKITADHTLIRELTQKITKTDRKKKVGSDGKNTSDSV